MKSIIKFFNKFDIGEPPWDYYFLQNLDEKEYPKYLAKLFKINTGENLPLKYDFKKQAWVIDKNRCKTFNQKLQWIKLYGVTDLMRDCTDKVKVRDYVRERIGEEYLKPVLQIIGNCSPSTSGRGRGEGIPLAENDVSTYFDQIDFDKLPNAFVIKTNHGCKWQYIIKDKNLFLQNKRLFDTVKKNITGWLEQEYWCWGGFEMQYATSRRVKSPDSISGARTRLCEGKVNDRTESTLPKERHRVMRFLRGKNYLPERQGCQEKGIKPKILIEPLMRDEIDILSNEIFIYCFNGNPKHIVYLNNLNNCITLFDENLKFSENIFGNSEKIVNVEANSFIKQALNFANQISEKFNFVRVDFMLFQNKLYFEELTFTPYSGFQKLNSKENNLKFGNLLNIER